MSNITLTKWQVYCEDESAFHETWTETKPTICPENTTHTLNHELTKQVHRIEPNVIAVQEERIPLDQRLTNRNFAVRSHHFDVDIGTTYTYSSETFPLPTSLIDVIVDIQDNMSEDQFYVDIGKDTIIGAITEAGVTGATELTVSDTVIDYLNNGYFVSMSSDGINFTEIGRCLSIDSVNKKITIENGLDIYYAPGTYIAMSIRLMDVIMGIPGRLRLAMNTVGGAYLPANTVITGTYINRNGESGAKHVTLYYEMYY